jgi:hypothetical protein
LEHVGTAAAQGCAAAYRVSFLPVRGRRVQFIGITVDTSDSDKGRLRIRESILYAHPASTMSRHIALAGAAM